VVHKLALFFATNGFELGLTGHITDKWEMAVGYSYLDSEVEKAAYNVFASTAIRVFCFSVRKIAAVTFARFSQRLHFVPTWRSIPSN
jgi:hypothetical protein